MQISILGSLSDTGGRSPVDACVQNLAQLRDEGFGRVWITQMPYEPDLLTVLAVALREVDTIEVGSGVLPIQIQHPMLLAQRALTLNLIAGGRFILGARDESPLGHRRNVGHLVGQAGAPDA